MWKSDRTGSAHGRYLGRNNWGWMVADMWTVHMRGAGDDTHLSLTRLNIITALSDDPL
jgi:hypothetical protein